MEITIGDENDNAPVFTTLPNTTVVKEDAASGTSVFTVIVRQFCWAIITRGTTSQLLGSISFSFFFLHVAISDSVQ